MAGGVGVVVARLRARREEIEDALFARVRDVVPDSVGEQDAEYVAGLRATVTVGVDFILTGIERGEGWPTIVPETAIVQARRAARSGVSLDVVMRRYMAGQALLWDYILEEADSVGEGGELREMLRTQASLLDRLVMDVAREHIGECERAGRSSEHRRLELVRALLAGEREDGAELGYELESEHLGVIARGARAPVVLRGLAQGLDRRLLCMARGEGTVWAWLGGRYGLRMSDLEGALCGQGESARDVLVAVGEPARGIGGWRLTHRQAQAALMVALRRPRRFTRYADVALLATALTDEALARTLIDVYVAPLQDARKGGQVLYATLHAYIAAERNVSSAAAALGVVRKTVESRLCAIEERLGRSLRPCPAELEVALCLEELGMTGAPDISTIG